MLKPIAPAVEKPTIHQNVEDADSETENNYPASTSTPMKSKATTPKITLISSSTNSILWYQIQITLNSPFAET